MHIRSYIDGDADTLIPLTVETFRPFYEESFPAMVNHDQRVIDHQHGDWQGDYRRDVPKLHDPTTGRHVAIAVDTDDRIVGYIAWQPDNSRPHHGEISLLAVEAASRDHGIGRALMRHAMELMRRDGVQFVGLGTGGDDFHAPARALYASLGFHPIPITGYLRGL